MIKTLITLFSTALLSTPVFAHTGMESSSVLHNVLHISASVGIYMALMLVGLYLFKRLPKAQKQKIRVKK